MPGAGPGTPDPPMPLAGPMPPTGPLKLSPGRPKLLLGLKGELPFCNAVMSCGAKFDRPAGDPLLSPLPPGASLA